MKYTLLALCLALGAPAMAQKPAPKEAVKYELRGVVTYYFNDNLGNKPDVGASAFVIKESALTAADIDIKALQMYLDDHDAAGDYMRAQKKPAMLRMPGEEYVLGSKELQDDAIKAEQFILKDESVSTLTADGSGLFTRRLAPGEYIVLIRSANRTRINPLEVGGQVVVRRVVIKDDDKEVSANFLP